MTAIRLSWILFAILFCPILLNADDLASVKQRMKERITVIDSLKAQKIVGENNRGFLDFVGKNREHEVDVKAENRDREEVYNEIAQKTNAKSDQVGRRRAKQIAENALPGTFIQDPDGTWKSK